MVMLIVVWAVTYCIMSELHKANTYTCILSVEPAMSAVDQRLLSRRADMIELLSKIVSFTLQFNFSKSI